jgi:hypothetical protein
MLPRPHRNSEQPSPRRTDYWGLLSLLGGVIQSLERAGGHRPHPPESNSPTRIVRHDGDDPPAQEAAPLRRRSSR